MQEGRDWDLSQREEIPVIFFLHFRKQKERELGEVTKKAFCFSVVLSFSGKDLGPRALLLKGGRGAGERQRAPDSYLRCDDVKKVELETLKPLRKRGGGRPHKRGELGKKKSAHGKLIHSQSFSREKKDRSTAHPFVQKEERESYQRKHKKGGRARIPVRFWKSWLKFRGERNHMASFKSIT